jgi:hypothetical protein
MGSIRLLPRPGFTSGLLRPQRRVLTSRRSRHKLAKMFFRKQSEPTLRSIIIKELFCISNNINSVIDWKCRVSIPVPLACKASALPFELHPHERWRYIGSIILAIGHSGKLNAISKFGKRAKWRRLLKFLPLDSIEWYRPVSSVG